MLKKFLATEGYEVEAAYDGESACKMLFEDEYALVLLDLMIPKIDGMEVMNVIRANSPPCRNSAIFFCKVLNRNIMNNIIDRIVYFLYTENIQNL
ncbi:MAG: response regulator [Lachnospiraceae bacterium]|nr:response regulator [Lachnospiraceae bacterium]